jgi:hypothetical protein
MIELITPEIPPPIRIDRSERQDEAAALVSLKFVNTGYQDERFSFTAVPPRGRLFDVDHIFGVGGHPNSWDVVSADPSQITIAIGRLTPRDFVEIEFAIPKERE